MDKNYYHEKMAKEREREVLDWLAQPRDNSHDPLSRKQARRLVLRIAFAIIVISALIYLI
jgi:hypothetical protein